MSRVIAINLEEGEAIEFVLSHDKEVELEETEESEIKYDPDVKKKLIDRWGMVVWQHPLSLKIFRIRDKTRIMI
jgi:hypothetical protein